MAKKKPRRVIVTLELETTATLAWIRKVYSAHRGPHVRQVQVNVIREKA